MRADPPAAPPTRAETQAQQRLFPPGSTRHARSFANGRTVLRALSLSLTHARTDECAEPARWTCAQPHRRGIQHILLWGSTCTHTRMQPTRTHSDSTDLVVALQIGIGSIMGTTTARTDAKPCAPPLQTRAAALAHNTRAWCRMGAPVNGGGVTHVGVVVRGLRAAAVMLMRCGAEACFIGSCGRCVSVCVRWCWRVHVSWRAGACTCAGVLVRARALACWCVHVHVRRRAGEADEGAQGAEGLGQGGCCKGKGGTEAATQSLCVAVLSDVAVRARCCFSSALLFLFFSLSLTLSPSLSLTHPVTRGM